MIPTVRQILGAAPCPPLLNVKSQSIAHAQASPAVSPSTAFAKVKQHAFTGAVPWGPVGLLLLIVAALYTRVGVKLVQDWINFPDYSHGLILPFFVAFLLWEQREQLRQVPLRPSWLGVPVVAFAMLILLTGVLGADLFLSRLSFLVLTAGLVLALFGPAMMHSLRFAFFVSFLAIPLPAVLLNHITFPLQIFASRLASGILPLAGVPVLREGNVITLPAMPLEVAEACSGIRSLVSLFTVAVIYGHLAEKRVSIRVLLACASLPIAIFANVLRIVGTGVCVQYWDPEKALGFFHEFSGWLLFLVSLFCLVVTRRLLLLLLKDSGR